MGVWPSLCRGRLKVDMLVGGWLGVACIRIYIACTERLNLLMEMSVACIACSERLLLKGASGISRFHCDQHKGVCCGCHFLQRSCIAVRVCMPAFTSFLFPCFIIALDVFL